MRLGRLGVAPKVRPVRHRSSHSWAADTQTDGRRTRFLAACVVVGLLSALAVVLAPSAAAATCVGNAIVCENQLPGTPESVWDINGAGDASIQGFATSMSADAGETVSFKIKTDAPAYRIEIYRLGYYQGNGARKVADVIPSADSPPAAASVCHRCSY